MIDETTTKGRLIAAALELARTKPWREVALVDIAEAAHVTLADVRREFHSKAEILTAFTAAIDDEVLRRATKRPADTTTRDAIFEVVMARFDAMQPYKEALRSLVAGADPDPAMLRRLIASQHWMLQAAGVDTSGMPGAVRVLGLASVYASVFRIWLDDADPGQARTMAALDRRLRRGEQNLKAMDSAYGAATGLADRLGELFRGARRRRETDPGASAAGPGTAPDGSASTGPAATSL